MSLLIVGPQLKVLTDWRQPKCRGSIKTCSCVPQTTFSSLVKWLLFFQVFCHSLQQSWLIPLWRFSSEPVEQYHCTKLPLVISSLQWCHKAMLQPKHVCAIVMVVGGYSCSCACMCMCVLACACDQRSTSCVKSSATLILNSALRLG